MGTFVQAFAELGTEKKIMKILLIVALAVAAVVGEPEAEAEAAADAWYGYYGYGRPYGYKTKWVDGYGYANYGHYVGKREAEADPGFVYTVGYPHAYGLPLVYTYPVAYANNVCTNEGGAVVPCAAGVAPGSGVYNFADAPVGLHPVVGVAPVAAAAAGDPWLVLKNVKLRLKLRLILRPRLPLMPGIHTTDVPAIMEDTTGMEATPE